MKVKNEGKSTWSHKFLHLFSLKTTQLECLLQGRRGTGKLNVRHSHIATDQRRHIIPRKGWVFNIVDQMHYSRQTEFQAGYTMFCELNTVLLIKQIPTYLYQSMRGLSIFQEILLQTFNKFVNNGKQRQPLVFTEANFHPSYKFTKIRQHTQLHRVYLSGTTIPPQTILVQRRNSRQLYHHRQYL